MDKIRAAVGPDINLQSLARGVNVVGLDSQSSRHNQFTCQNV